jgi:hypothetical protein
MHLKTLFYDNHSPKTCIFTFVNTLIIKCTQKVYTKSLSQGLTQSNNMNYKKENMNPKLDTQPLYICKEEWMDYQLHSSTYPKHFHSSITSQ